MVFFVRSHPFIYLPNGQDKPPITATHQMWVVSYHIRTGMSADTAVQHSVPHIIAYLFSWTIPLKISNISIAVCPAFSNKYCHNDQTNDIDLRHKTYTGRWLSLMAVKWGRCMLCTNRWKQKISAAELRRFAFSCPFIVIERCICSNSTTDGHPTP